MVIDQISGGDYQKTEYVQLRIESEGKHEELSMHSNQINGVIAKELKSKPLDSINRCFVFITCEKRLMLLMRMPLSNKSMSYKNIRINH